MIATAPAIQADEILQACKAQWGQNYQMIEFCVKQQREAKAWLSQVPRDEIYQSCRAQWGNNYNMVKFCVQQQREAKRRLGI